VGWDLSFHWGRESFWGDIYRQVNRRLLWNASIRVDKLHADRSAILSSPKTHRICINLRTLSDKREKVDMSISLHFVATPCMRNSTCICRMMYIILFKPYLLTCFNFRDCSELSRKKTRYKTFYPLNDVFNILKRFKNYLQETHAF